MDTRPPHLQSVLASVLLGRVARHCLTPAQAKSLRDREGRIALDVLRHLIGRPLVAERFLLTEQAFQAVANKLGYVVGQKRCQLMVKRLSASGVVVRCGHYRQPYRNSASRSGYRVALFKPGRRLRAPRPATRKRPVGKRELVKAAVRPRWWGVVSCQAYTPSAPSPTINATSSRNANTST
jgi:hypothetical protein